MSIVRLEGTGELEYLSADLLLESGALLGGQSSGSIEACGVLVPTVGMTSANFTAKQ